MNKISWDKFKTVNENYRIAFEDLSYHLFCRRFKIKDGIRTDYNQVGLETEPIFDPTKNENVGFQAKFFDNKLSDHSSVKQIKDSITKAKNKYSDLNRIIIYTHKQFGSKKTKYEKNIEEEAGKIEIEWVVKSNFEILLAENIDLAQLYFDLSDELGFVKHQIDSRVLTLLRSLEYIELPFISEGSEKKVNCKSVAENILKKQNKTFLMTGHPGAGKSVFMHYLFQLFSGLNMKGLNEVKRTMVKNQACPMSINLKNCASKDIESIIRDRQSDYKIKATDKLGFIYLLDGLDELNEEKTDSVLSYLHELCQAETTKKIIVSCRSGNLNRAKLKKYFEDMVEYGIGNLTQKHIKKYFIAKNKFAKKKKSLDKLKIAKNKFAKKKKSLDKLKNKNLLSEVKDIIQAEMLWDTFDKLDENSTVIDLIDKKIKLLLTDPRYKKNIEELNILNPKEKEIIEINQAISLYFQKKFQFRLPQNELQALILARYPRIDYRSVNEILNYLANSFFDDYTSDTPRDDTDDKAYIYKHRSYQDYFFIQGLAKKYEENPNVLREFGVLSNRNFFENYFLNYLRKEQVKNKNLPGIVELNLMDVYQGNRNDFGVDDPCYQNSSKFIPALAVQDDLVFQELLGDENLAIKDKITIDLNELQNKFKDWDKDKSDWRLADYLRRIWEDGLSFLFKNITIFWSFNKKSEAKKLRKIANEVICLFKQYKFEENFKEIQSLQNPFRINWQDYIYLQIVIDDKDPGEIFELLIRQNYRDFSNKSGYVFKKAEKKKLIKSFFLVCVDNKLNKLIEIIDILSNEEMLMLVGVFVACKYIPFLIQNSKLSQSIEKKIRNLDVENLSLLFCKKLLGIKTTTEEKEFAERLLNELREKQKNYPCMLEVFCEFSMASYILNINSFDEFLMSQKEYPIRYYHELGLYAALFIDYIKILRQNKRIDAVAGDYIRYVKFYTEVYNGKNLEAQMSFLWAYIFANSNVETQKLTIIKRRLIVEDNNLWPLSFCLKLQQLDRALFGKLIDEEDLRNFENILNAWDGYFSGHVDNCFNLASFYAQIDRQKVSLYIAKGINDGFLRHGWRKDYIVSYSLVDALEILWKNHWLTKAELEEYTNRVFNLAVRVTKITDGSDTYKGPYNVIKLVSKYDIEFSIILKERLREPGSLLNLAITSILIGKINLGMPFDEVEKGMQEYIRSYLHKGKQDSDCYEQKFKIYLTLAKSDFYTTEEREKAFNNAYNQIEEMKRLEIDYFLGDCYFKNEKQVFAELCEKYSRKINVTFEEQSSFTTKPKISENVFVRDLKKAKTWQKITGLYRKLDNYKNGIVLTKHDSWLILLEKTYSINKNIKLFINLLRKNAYPHTDFYTSNSEYLHFGVAAALKTADTREEILGYLFGKTTGHGGFSNIMKCYAVNGDKEMCLRLFERYLRFCHFLVY